MDRVAAGTFDENQQMALTPLRWLAIALMTFMAVLALVLQELPERVDYKRDEQDERLSIAASDARRQANRTARRWEMARVVDSLRGPFSQPARQSIRVMYGSNVAPALRGVIDSTIARGAERLGNSLLIGVDIAVVYDTSENVRGAVRNSSGAGNFYSLPTAAGQRCLGVMTVGREYGDMTRKALRGEEAAEQVFGPCAYYAVFGMPGPAVASWMEKRGSLLSLGGSWTRAATRATESRRPHIKYFEAGHAALDYLSPRGTQCAAGDAEVCEQIALKPNPYIRTLSVGSIVYPIDRLGSVSWYQSDLGGREVELFAGMVRSLGREKFGAFWRSSDPVPVAFERASGLPLGKWIVSHLSEQFGELRHGPSTSAISLLSAAIIVGLAIFVAVRAAMRREYA